DPGQKFNAKTYRAKDYGGTKSAWTGNFRLEDKKAATTGKYEIVNVKRAIPVKSQEVSAARESDKGAATREYAGLRPFWKRGRSQDRFDSEGGTPKDDKAVGWTGDLKPMTIDDVRELLNKNK